MIITGNCDGLLEETSGQDPRRQKIEQIKLAAERAAEITRQLIALGCEQAWQSGPDREPSKGRASELLSQL